MGEAHQPRQDLWWTKLINPYTLQFEPDLEAEYAVKHANNQRAFDCACAVFELVADIAVLVFKQSNSIGLELRANFLDRWGSLLGLLTILNRGAPFFLWRGAVIAGARLTRCMIFFGWLALNRVCALHVPCFIARGSILDGVVTTMLVLPFMARLRFAHHIPLQVMAACTAVLMVSGPAGTCAVFDAYASTPIANADSCPSWVNTTYTTTTADARTPNGIYGPASLVTLQDWAVAPWQVAMLAVDGPSNMVNACWGCVERATAERQPCALLPSQLKSAHGVAQRLLGWMLALPVPKGAPGQSQAACWSMCVFLVVLATYVVGCVLYSLELRHRVVFAAMRRPRVRLHPGEKELGSQVAMYQIVFLYFAITLTWMTLCVLVA